MRSRSFLRPSTDPSGPRSPNAYPSRSRPPLPGARTVDRSNYLEDDDVEHQTLLIDDTSPSGDSPHQAPTKGPLPEETPLFSYLFQHAVRIVLSSRIAMISLIAIVFVAVVSFLFAARFSIYVLYLRVLGTPPGVYSREGVLYVGRRIPFHIKGFSWFGMEEDRHVLGGLSKTSMYRVFTFAKSHDFNAIRLPLSVENIRKNPITTHGIGTFHNAHLSQVSYLESVRIVIHYAAENDMLVLLDLHRLHNSDVQSEGFWYADDVPQEHIFDAWRELCTQFRDEWNVLGADLVNEPWKSTWGTGSPFTDWKIVSEQLGNEVHKECPSWLVFIQGVGNQAGNIKTGAFWSENLRAMQDKPPQLKLESKVVLSPHVYGPSVFMQDYFKVENFSRGLPQIWDDHFGEASHVTGLGTVIGEWGGKYVGKDAVWQRRFMEYINKKQMGSFYWCLNPESDDTDGLLQDDWKTPRHDKLSLLSRALFTRVDPLKPHFQKWRKWHV